MGSRAGHDFVTPEAVAIDLPIAGLGSRVLASMLDVLIQGAVFAIATVAAITLSDLVPNETAALVITIGGTLLILAGYYLLFEGLWEGQTPGKRAVGLQVVTELGQPVGWRHVIIRTLFRIVDMGLSVGPIVMLLSSKSQRLGDLTAGTLVVRRHRAPDPTALEFPPNRQRDELAGSLDTTGVSDGDYALVRSFLVRRADLTREARSQVAARLAGTLKANAGLDGQGLDDESFLEAVILSRRREAAGA